MLSTEWMEGGALVSLTLLELRLPGFPLLHIFPDNHYLIEADGTYPALPK